VVRAWWVVLECGVGQPGIGQQGAPPVPAVLMVNKMAPNCDKRTADTAYWMAASEGGFINSQPSMAEFLNHLSPESPKIGTPVGSGAIGGVGVNVNVNVGVGVGYPVGVVPQTPDGMDSVPEYPWMKEKKTSRKSSNNNNQGEYRNTLHWGKIRFPFEKQTENPFKY